MFLVLSVCGIQVYSFPETFCQGGYFVALCHFLFRMTLCVSLVQTDEGVTSNHIIYSTKYVPGKLITLNFIQISGK